jgi:hypothetical protein
MPLPVTIGDSLLLMQMGYEIEFNGGVAINVVEKEKAPRKGAK